MCCFPSRFRLRPALGFALWALLALGWVAPLRANSSEELTAQFLDEAPGAWEKYRDFADRLQGSIQSTMTVGEKPHSSSRLEFKSNAQGRLVLYQAGPPGAPEGRLQVFNSVYGFLLSRKAADAPWAVKKVRMGDNRYDPQDWESNGWTSLYGCISAGGNRLTDLVRQPNFRVVRAATVQFDGAALVEINFANPHPWKAGPFFPVQAGSLLLDPAHSWTLRGFTLRYETQDGKSTVKADHELRDPAAKYPTQRRSVQVHDMPERKEGSLVVTTVIESDLKEASRPPGDEEFILSAFGLPEPTGVTWPTRTRWYLWFIACGVLSLAAAGFFWRRVQARRG